MGNVENHKSKFFSIENNQFKERKINTQEHARLIEFSLSVRSSATVALIHYDVKIFTREIVLLSSLATLYLLFDDNKKAQGWLPIYKIN